MTELRLAIGHLKETISVGNVLLAKLKEQQKEAKKAKTPKFPSWFTIVKDNHTQDDFVIGLRGDNIQFWEELPDNFKGRACFNRYDLRQIIVGIQTLLGDSNA